MKSQVLQVEFNELCPQLIDRFIGEGKLPNFKSLRDSSLVLTSEAEESGEKLNPWVQWATVHTGLSADEHGIETLSEGSKVIGKNIWDVISKSNLPSLVFGSMNASYQLPFGGYVLPDPWSTGTEAHPPACFDDYYNFVRTAVQEHSSQSGGIARGSALAFLRFMALRGLSLATCGRTLRQLFSERLGDTKWRRAGIMDLLQMDLFRYFWRKTRPAFATFFLNSTAHFQHCYWRHFQPEEFGVRPPEKELATYADAIPFGYRAMDRILGKLLRLAGPQCSVIFCTGLSQQPYVKFEEVGGRNYYRPHDHTVLRTRLGFDFDYAYEPVMAEQFFLRFPSDALATAASASLQGCRLSLDGKPSEKDCPAFSLLRRENSLLAQCNCTQLVPKDAILYGPSLSTVGFDKVFYRLEALKSGCHHPEGALWIRSPNVGPARTGERASIRSIAPTGLQLLGLAPAPWMTCPSVLRSPISRKPALTATIPSALSS